MSLPENVVSQEPVNPFVIPNTDRHIVEVLVRFPAELVSFTVKIVYNGDGCGHIGRCSLGVWLSESFVQERCAFIDLPVEKAVVERRVNAKV